MKIAYRMLGTMSDAEDVLQDAYVRWHQTERSAVGAVEGLLVTTVVRLAIDWQRRRITERKLYPGQWLPEPWHGEPDADDLGYAAQVLLERLTPEERAAFLLREVFDVDYEFVANALEKTEAACRKLVQRAKQHLAEANMLATPPRYAPKRDEHDLLVAQLLAAMRAESSESLERLLSQAVQMRSDGGGKVFAAKTVLCGASRVATALWRIRRKLGSDLREHLVTIAGERAIAGHRGSNLSSLTFLETDGSRVSGVFVLLSPDKVQPLARLIGPEP